MTNTKWDGREAEGYRKEEAARLNSGHLFTLAVKSMRTALESWIQGKTLAEFKVVQRTEIHQCNTPHRALVDEGRNHGISADAVKAPD